MKLGCAGRDLAFLFTRPMSIGLPESHRVVAIPRVLVPRGMALAWWKGDGQW